MLTSYDPMQEQLVLASHTDELPGRQIMPTQVVELVSGVGEDLVWIKPQIGATVGYEESWGNGRRMEILPIQRKEAPASCERSHRSMTIPSSSYRMSKAEPDDA